MFVANSNDTVWRYITIYILLHKIFMMFHSNQMKSISEVKTKRNQVCICLLHNRIRTGEYKKLSHKIICFKHALVWITINSSSHYGLDISMTWIDNKDLLQPQLQDILLKQTRQVTSKAPPIVALLLLYHTNYVRYGFTLFSSANLAFFKFV